MVKKFFDYMLSGYSDSSVEIQKKALYLIMLILLLYVCFILLFISSSENLFIILLLTFFAAVCTLSLILIKNNRFETASLLMNTYSSFFVVSFILSMEKTGTINIFYIYAGFLSTAIFLACLISTKRYHIIFEIICNTIGLGVIALMKFDDYNVLIKDILTLKGILFICIFIFLAFTLYLLFKLNKDILKVTDDKKNDFEKANKILTEIISMSKDITMKLNSSSKEIEAAAQEQTTASNEHASGITEVSATLEELSITAKQITQNVSELVLSSEETIRSLHENEKQLLETVSQIDDLGNISKSNATQIIELGKRSNLINEMVELIKEVANKTNILSINASIEASRSGDGGTGFSVVAAEIRELSKETINSAKSVERAAKEIQDFLNCIIISSESESGKVISSAKTVKTIYENVDKIVEKINKNYSFTQKIDVSIKQQESGSRQATDTMKQMAEVARQSAETSRQILTAVKDIVTLSMELDGVVKKINLN